MSHLPDPAQPESGFAHRLLAWQRRHGRHDLPWQNTRDPYRIWLSEIMLQQTQVATVIPYYQRFLDYFPTVADLAAAPVERVLELWAGLGYYARARNLHRCAQAVVTEHGGHFPVVPEVLAELPGIGRSTAAAIASFAVGARAAILDGNVKRVLCRHFGIEGVPGTSAVDKALWQLAESLLPREIDMPTYSQGIMDLGATLCTRSAPRCPDCPLAETCIAQASGRQEELPMAKPRRSVPERHTYLLLITDGPRVWLERRPPVGIWGGLLVPPEGEAGDTLALRYGLTDMKPEPLAPLRHVFTHFRLTLQPLLYRVEHWPNTAAEAKGEWLALADIDGAALPKPIHTLLGRLAADLL